MAYKVDTASIKILDSFDADFQVLDSEQKTPLHRFAPPPLLPSLAMPARLPA